MVHLRQTLSFCKRLDLIGTDDYLKATDLEPIKGESLPVGRYIDKSEIQALCRACQEDASVFGVRDLAMIWILRIGLRRSELTKLDLCDFNVTDCSLFIRQAKGNRDRLVYLPEQAIAPIERWIVVRGSEPGALLHPISAAGRVLCERRMNDQTVRTMLLKRGKQAGIEPFSPHDFRRTAISDLLEANVDIEVIQEISGHTTPMGVFRYDRRPEEARKRAAKHLSI
jgi:integrase